MGLTKLAAAIGIGALLAGCSVVGTTAGVAMDAARTAVDLTTDAAETAVGVVTP